MEINLALHFLLRDAVSAETENLFSTNVKQEGKSSQGNQTKRSNSQFLTRRSRISASLRTFCFLFPPLLSITCQTVFTSAFNSDISPPLITHTLILLQPLLKCFNPLISETQI